MARASSLQRRVTTTAAGWIVGFLIFFPILWMVITSFKTELEAFSTPPKFLFFHWTLENFGIVQQRSDYLRFAANSIILSLGSTLVGLLFAIPAAWAMAFAPGKRTKDLLLWMLSTKMMPPVGALIPIYLLFKNTGLLDTHGGLIAVEFLINLPIIVWMLFTYFKEIPGEILEAARMDGATLWREIVYVLTPMAVPGIASTVLLNVFAEILVTTGGGPGLDTTNIPFLVYAQALLQFDVGGASAGGIVAVVLAKIVAFFFVRMIGRNLEA